MNTHAQKTLHYDDIADSLKNKAEIIFLGKYKGYRGAGFRSHGRNIHRLHHGFEVVKVMKGDLKTKNVPRGGLKYYKTYQYYWVLLSPSQSMRQLLSQKLIDPAKWIKEENFVAILPAKAEK
ncbi:hypothetical protein BKI52_06985 [marine bacterium AO1-C]|nr:hypothetical protein BKI52_06985 [marine bacterium AO1-C]